ncbi:MAG TPA: winged helix-turn-helix domain-containing protein [Candidatus Angelobacter sp.]|nr:winged helix-turn-helix domain-containing protein [Candidatus Angelobacter sp.]
MPHTITYKFGPFRFEDARLLCRKDKRIHLTPKEASVLLVLLENAGRIVEKEEFRKRVWPHFKQDIGALLKKTIHGLRKALCEKKKSDQYISMHSGLGYRFEAKVEIIEEFRPPDKKPGLMLAVLPFRNLGGSKLPEYFIDGLTYEITIQLSRLNPEKLGVRAPISSMQYKKSTNKIRQVGKALRVNYLLTGAAFRAGNKVRISVQLIDAADESQVWAETYERKLDDILVLLREVCQDIARKIEIKLVPHEQARLDYLEPVKPEAYKSYLNGRYLWNKRTPKTLQEATVLFKKAIALDSRFALAHSALADCYAVIASQSWIPPAQACNNAKLAATKAMELDHTHAEPHAALGFVLSVFEHDWGKAEQEFQEALRLNANYATAHHWYSFYLAALNRLPEAIEQVKKAQEIDPLSWMINTNVGTMLYWDRQYDAAIEEYSKVLNVENGFWYAYWMRGLAYDEKKQYRKSAADQRKAIQHFPGDSSLLMASLARTLALSGDQKGARRQLKEANQSSKYFSLPHYHIGMAHAALGEKDIAYRCLLESCSSHEMWASFIQIDPKMDTLRNDLRYMDLRRRLSL